MTTKEDSPYTPEAITKRVLTSLTPRYPDISEDRIQKVVTDMFDSASIPHYIDVLAAREIEQQFRSMGDPEAELINIDYSEPKTTKPVMQPVTVLDQALHTARTAVRNVAENIKNAASSIPRLIKS